MDNSQELKRTPLHGLHVSQGGRMVDFSGWEMPVQYSGILGEARAVRSGAGLFDVSHMGRVEIRGPGAASFLGRVYSVDAVSQKIGRARYGVICNEEGGIIDDCILYRRGKEDFLLAPNASNSADVLNWLRKWLQAADEARIQDVSANLAMMALQGPLAESILQGLVPIGLAGLRTFRTVETKVAGIDALLARTGYTGEDGFEIILRQESAPDVWALLMEKGAKPCGLGARDVLRLEAGLLLHGNDMDTSTNPYEAGLGRFVDPDRDEYVAGEALRRIRDAGPGRLLLGFKMVGRGVARHGYPIRDSTGEIGHVTSGGYSPTLDTNIGLGYVPTGHSTGGSRFHIDIRGRLVEAEVTTLPFYARRKSA